MKKSWIHGGTILIRVGPHHFAFLRGYLQGLDLAVLSKRYLETAVMPDPELRIAKSILKWIREQLLVAARRRGHFPDARLILIDPDKLRHTTRRAIPSLEEFREERDPHELYSEAELIELFQEEYGTATVSDRRVVRNERLRRRQLNALLELEKLVGSPPALNDDVAGWLDPMLAKRLKAAGLTTLGSLVEIINGRGYRWWIHVPRFGAKAAAQVVAWLKNESVERALGVSLGPQAVIKATRLPAATLHANRVKQTAIVPLEHLLLPSVLDGSRGRNRGANCKIEASNDLDAIQQWLDLKPNGGSTWRSYRKEAERFLLWAIMERRCALSSLSSQDCDTYLEFLRRLDPDCDGNWTFRLPRENWFAPRGTKRWSALWRPFEGPLSADSQKLAVTVLTLMGRWFVESGYWISNPWEEIAHDTRVAPTDKGKNRRGFSESQWELIWGYLESMPKDAKYERLRFILSFCQESGLRLSEMVNARVGHLATRAQLMPPTENDLPEDPRDGTIALSQNALADLDRYLAHRGLGNHLTCNPSTFLIAKLPSTRPAIAAKAESSEISANALYQAVKRFFLDFATALTTGTIAQSAVSLDFHTLGESSRFALAARVRAASTEWLRQ